MEVWWSDGQVKLASVVSVAVADNDREQDQARILPPLPQLLYSDTHRVTTGTVIPVVTLYLTQHLCHCSVYFT